MEGEISQWIGQFISEAPTAGALLVMVWMFLRDRKQMAASHENSSRAIAEALQHNTQALTELRIALFSRNPPVPFPESHNREETRR